MVWVHTSRGKTWNITPLEKHGDFVLFCMKNSTYIKRGDQGPEFFYFIAHKSRSGQWKGIVERIYEAHAQRVWSLILNGTFRLS